MNRHLIVLALIALRELSLARSLCILSIVDLNSSQMSQRYMLIVESRLA